jgi:hypothetical protein
MSNVESGGLHGSSLMSVHTLAEDLSESERVQLTVAARANIVHTGNLDPNSDVLLCARQQRFSVR